MAYAHTHSLPEGDLRQRILNAISQNADRDPPGPGNTAGTTAGKRSGLLFVRFEGTSMQPGLKHGDVLVVEPLSGQVPQVGDIVLRPRSGQVFEAHRVIRVQQDPLRVVTRGDSRPFQDRPWDPRACGGAVVALMRGNALLQPPATPSAWMRLFALTRLIGGTLVRKISFSRS